MEVASGLAVSRRGPSNSMCFVVISVVLAKAKEPAKLQSQVSSDNCDFFADGEVFFQVCFQEIDVFDVEHGRCRVSVEADHAVDQAFGRFRADIGLVPFGVLFDVFVGEALHLFVRQGNPDGLFGFARCDQHGQLFAHSGDIGSASSRFITSANDWSSVAIFPRILYFFNLAVSRRGVGQRPMALES